MTFTALADPRTNRRAARNAADLWVALPDAVSHDEPRCLVRDDGVVTCTWPEVNGHEIEVTLRGDSVTTCVSRGGEFVTVVGATGATGISLAATQFRHYLNVRAAPGQQRRGL